MKTLTTKPHLLYLAIGVMLVIIMLLGMLLFLMYRERFLIGYISGVDDVLEKTEGIVQRDSNGTAWIRMSDFVSLSKEMQSEIHCLCEQETKVMQSVQFPQF